MPPTIEPERLSVCCERLKLRPLAAGDAPALFDIFSDPSAMRHQAMRPWPSLAHARQVVEAELAARTSGGLLRMVITEPDRDVPIGCCAISDVQRDVHRAEIAYSLARSHWRQGLMTQALERFIPMVLRELRLHRLEAMIHPANHASARLAVRLGFEMEGRLRARAIVDAELSDVCVYGLLRRDWRGARAAGP